LISVLLSVGVFAMAFLMARALKRQQNKKKQSKEDEANEAKQCPVTDIPVLYDYMLDKTLRMSPAQTHQWEEVQASERAQLAGSRDEAQFLAFLVQLLGFRRVLEVGVFMGSTALALAQALPNDGQYIGLDLSSEYTDIAKNTGRRQV